MEFYGNGTSPTPGVGVNPTVKTVEGGFLSGRNPLSFNEHVPLPTFIIQLVLIITMSRLVKLVLSPIRQPSVIAEIISGIILGPTVLGHIPYYAETIFPKVSLPFLNLMSNFGLVLFLFLVGLELDPKMLKKSMKKSLSISLAGMILPFGCGAGAAYALYSLVEPADTKVTFIKYFLFLGVAMSITAFPVLARILTELNLLKTKIGSITISAAAADDATSWCLLALVISLINAGTGLIAVYVFLIGLGYSLFILLVVRPIYILILRRSGAFSENEPSQPIMCLTLLLVFTSAFITDIIGIHAIFGGFLVGIMTPHERGLAYKITKKLEDIVSVLFLPLYFALSGLKTQIGSLNDTTSWSMVCLVIFVACSGKIVGCMMAARVSRLSWRESFTIGVLMNCKGLVELIVLNLGYDAKIISERTFAIMVIMALFTTFLTVPIVTFVYPPRYHTLGSDLNLAQHPASLPEGLETGQPVKPTNLGNGGGGDDDPTKKSSLLVCVNEIEHVPSILSVIHLFESQWWCSGGGSLSELKKKEDDENGGGGGGHKKTSGLPCVPHAHAHKEKSSNKKKLVVNALRLIEITERDSSVMIQTSPDALREDPVMKMIEAFGKVTSLVNIRGLVEVVTATNFARSIVKTASEVKASFIIIPWCGNAISGDSNSAALMTTGGSSGIRRSNRRTASNHSTTSSKYVEFIQDILTSKTPASVLILVDRGVNSSSSTSSSKKMTHHQPSKTKMAVTTTTTPSDQSKIKTVQNIDGLVSYYQHIYLLFFGGPDDRHALQIVLATAGTVQAEHMQIHIVRFKYPVNCSPKRGERRNSNVGGGSIAGSEAEIISDNQFPAGNFEIEIEEDMEATKDAVETQFINDFFEKGPYRNDELSRLTYTEIETRTPIQTAVDCIKNFDNQYLVLVGREHEPGFVCDAASVSLMKNADADRRKVLGDVAESILLSPGTPSVLIIRTSKNDPEST